MHKHALASGGTGFIDSHLVVQLLDEGRRMAVADDYQVLNSVNNQTVGLSDMVEDLGRAPSIEAKPERFPNPQGDGPSTWSDVEEAAAPLAYRPKPEPEQGLKRTAAWLGKVYAHGTAR